MKTMMCGFRNKPRVYISGKISGLPKEEYTSKFNEAERRLRHLGFDVANPANDHVAEFLAKISYRLVMLYDLLAVKGCACIYLLDNCTDSRGAAEEIECAILNDLAIVTEEMDDKSILETLKWHSFRILVNQSMRR